jgi:prepilin-type N-terminal cleavage/methylation domain-containing protein
LRRDAFSLVELVMVVFIIAVIAAIAVPRVAHASRNAQATALFGSIVNVRQGIDFYQAEHGKYPGYNPQTNAPSGTWFVDQLTMWSNAAGQTSESPSAQYCYGPYLRKPFPANPLNQLATVRVRQNHGGMGVANGIGWFTCLEDGCFTSNATSKEVERLGVDAMQLVRISGAGTVSEEAVSGELEATPQVGGGGLGALGN